MVQVENISVIEARLYHFYITDCQDPENTEHFEYIVDKYASDINLKNSEIRIRWHIRINAHQKVKKAKHDIFLDAYAHVIFKIQDLNTSIQNNEMEMPILDQQLLLMLAGIAFSTIRGLLAGAVKGTLFHEAYLPVYSPKKLVDQSIADV